MASALKILRTYGYNATAGLAEDKAKATQTSRSVVVVGEVKRGKSALVNALLEVPNASPVDVDVATSAAVHLVPESEAYPAGWIDLSFAGETRRVPASELPDWVTQRGRYVSDPNIDALPTRVIVPVPSDPFGGAMVVDTPGTGGLQAAHAQMAVRSAQRACVLVVVADASSPLTAPEMEFIRKTSSTVESIIVVVTKTDKNLRRWRSIVAEDKRLLAEHLKRNIPVIGVSSVRALVACDLPEGPQRDAYMEASGIVALRAAITEKMALGENFAEIDGMRTALEGLRTVNSRIADDIKATKENVKAIPELTEERDRLKQLKDHSAAWEMHFNRDLTYARQAAMDHLDKSLGEIKDKWTTRINKQGMDVLRKNPQIFTAEIEADLMFALAATLDVFLKRLHAIAAPLFATPEPWNEIYQMIAGVMTKPQQLSTSEVASKKQGLVDPMVMSMGLSGSSLAGVIGGGLGLAAGAATGIGAVAAVTWIGINLAFRAMRTGRNNLLTWMRETLANTKSIGMRLVETAMVTGRTEMVLRYRTDIRDRTEEVTRRLNEAQLAAKQDAAEREKKVQRLAKNQQIVNSTIAELESGITSLSKPQPVSA